LLGYTIPLKSPAAFSAVVPCEVWAPTEREKREKERKEKREMHMYSQVIFSCLGSLGTNLFPLFDAESH
jgi:hypothetical protein